MSFSLLSVTALLALSACGKSGSVDIDPADTSESADGATSTSESADTSSEATGTTDGTSETDTLEDCELVGGALALAAEGDFIARGAALEATRARCTQVAHAGAGAAGSTLLLTLEDWSGAGAVQVSVTDLLGEPLADWAPLAIGEALRFEPAISGEFLVRLAPADPHEPETDYALSIDCEAGCELSYTRYPLVMMHGMGGTDTFGDDLLDYWYQLAEPMAEAGYHAEMRGVTSWDPIDQRSVLWQEVLDALVAEGVGRRFNLIGHSQGGLDARYLAGVLEPEAGQDRIVSITTVASPHRGSSVADLFAGIISEDSFFAGVIDTIVEGLSGVIGLTGDDMVAQIADLSTTQMADFNAAVLDQPGIRYYSWAGHSCAWLDFSCQEEQSGERVDASMVTSFWVVSLIEGVNDGLVPLESARWGEFLGEIPADHMDQVGQIADSSNESFDHIQFYLDEAARLADEGF